MLDSTLHPAFSLPFSPHSVTPSLCQSFHHSTTLFSFAHMQAKLSDFGLVWKETASSQVLTHSVQQGEVERTQVMGASLYADPEYIRTGKPTVSSDIYRYARFVL